jgi:hypothetical protein
VNVIVFVGPTLSGELARRELDAVYLPPAAQGDVYRAALKQPVAIGIIDGEFDQVPSVWHKEILWAMSQGIHVYGASSMGALRAAELAAFGMKGVGRIFQAYTRVALLQAFGGVFRPNSSDALEDDDEVAVVHGTQEDGFRVLSEAMVNIRGTLAQAEQQSVISASLREGMEKIAKALHYPDRSYAHMLEIAERNGLPAPELAAFCDWLPAGKIDQKREDALEMLRVMRADLEQGLPPMSVDYKFENSVVWSALVNSAGMLHTGSEVHGNLSVDDILSELWADPELCLQAYQYAMIRHLVRQAAQATGASVTSEKMAAVEAAFRADRGLAEQPALERWLEEHHMTALEFEELITHEALLHQSSLAPEPFPHRWMIDWLRISGKFDAVLAAALENKSSVAHQDSVDWQNPEVAADALLRWYLDRLAADSPANASTRAMLPYLRKDWEAFVSSLVRRQRSRAADQSAG